MKKNRIYRKQKTGNTIICKQCTYKLIQIGLCIYISRNLLSHVTFQFTEWVK